MATPLKKINFSYSTVNNYISMGPQGPLSKLCWKFYSLSYVGLVKQPQYLLFHDYSSHAVSILEDETGGWVERNEREWRSEYYLSDSLIYLFLSVSISLSLPACDLCVSLSLFFCLSLSVSLTHVHSHTHTHTFSSKASVDDCWLQLAHHLTMSMPRLMWEGINSQLMKGGVRRNHH